MEKELKAKARLEEEIERNNKKYKRRRILVDKSLLTPAHVEYWAKGMGDGGSKAWKFSCICGDQCSSYENSRYHPTGRMFECTNCGIWSHVLCVLGSICDDDLEELPVRRIVVSRYVCLLTYKYIY